MNSLSQAQSSLRRLLPLILLCVGLTACDSVRETFDTQRKTPPDEFRVVRQAPLSLPPSYGLRPPDPGAPRPQTGTATDQARSAVFERPVDPEAAAAAAAAAASANDSRSAGEQALLSQAGATGVDPSIRQQISEETDQLVAQQSSFVDRLIFWRDTEATGEIIDPAAEQQRIRENEALGRDITAGDTPVIERRKRAIFEDIF